MKNIRFPIVYLVFLTLVFHTSGIQGASTLQELSSSFEALSKQVQPAVVEIFTTGFGAETVPGVAQGSLFTRQRTSGSGVIVDPNGYVITNAHVIQGARRLQVLLPLTTTSSKSILKPKGKIVSAKLIGMDTETDLAVLKLDGTGLPFLPIGDSDELKPGQLVLAFGGPFGLENSVTMGVVSAVARQLRAEDPMIYIQTDTSINPGNSGGPLVDASGRIVGINTFIFSQSGGNEGVGFAAPGNIVKNVYQQIRANGRVHRGEIGVSVQTITPVLAAGLSLPQDYGVIVGDVTPKGPAERAGLQVGDIIITLDGKVIENGRQFDVNLYRRAMGDRVKLEVLRGNEKLAVETSVIARSDDSDRYANIVHSDQNIVPQLGIFCVDLDDDLAKLLPGLRKQYGVIVAARIADAPYAASGFRAGDVIHSINGTLVTGLPQLRLLLAKMKQGDPIVLQLERSGQLSFMSFELE